MSGHRAIPHDPAGQPRATGHGCTGLVRLLYANRAKVNVYVSQQLLLTELALVVTVLVVTAVGPGGQPRRECTR